MHIYRIAVEGYTLTIIIKSTLWYLNSSNPIWYIYSIEVGGYTVTVTYIWLIT